MNGDETDYLHTRIGWSTADTITVAGRDLARDLMGNLTLTELAYLLIVGRQPSPGERRIVDAVLVSLADHGITPSSLATRLTYTGAPLTKAVHIMGPPQVDLFAATTGTDSDWVVKLIDVYPNENPEGPSQGSKRDMSGFELPIGIEIFRGRYLDSFAKPRALRAGQVEHYHWGLPNVNHVFLPGHKIMVEIQSSLFPVYDRNPGYPFFIPGYAGHRAPHPPLDFAWKEDPKDPGHPLLEDGRKHYLDGGLPRHLVLGGGHGSSWINSESWAANSSRTEAGSGGPCAARTPNDSTSSAARAVAITSMRAGEPLRLAKACGAPRGMNTVLPAPTGVLRPPTSNVICPSRT